jgi:hypothetical protein
MTEVWIPAQGVVAARRFVRFLRVADEVRWSRSALVASRTVRRGGLTVASRLYLGERCFGIAQTISDRATESVNIKLRAFEQRLKREEVKQCASSSKKKNRKRAVRSATKIY